MRVKLKTCVEKIDITFRIKKEGKEGGGLHMNYGY